MYFSLISPAVTNSMNLSTSLRTSGSGRQQNRNLGQGFGVLCCKDRLSDFSGAMMQVEFNRYRHNESINVIFHGNRAEGLIKQRDINKWFKGNVRNLDNEDCKGLE